MDVLKSRILHPGTKFAVNDKSEDSTYGPGTLGYVSHIKGFDQDFLNVAYLVTVIIRRGKTGKNRLETAEISAPIFEVDDPKFKEKMPDEKRRYYVHIDPMDGPCDIASMEDYDFMGWSTALAMFVNKLCGKSRHFQPWPKSKSHVLNRALNLPGIWNESEEQAVFELMDPEVREEFAMNIRRMESTLVKASLVYLSKLASLEEDAAGYILKNLDNKKAAKTYQAVMMEAGSKKNNYGKLAQKLSPSKKSK